MTNSEAEMISDFDFRKFVEEHYAPVEDKPGYVWLSKRNFEIISIETFAKSLEEGLARGLYNSPLGESEG